MIDTKQLDKHLHNNYSPVKNLMKWIYGFEMNTTTNYCINCGQVLGVYGLGNSKDGFYHNYECNKNKKHARRN